MSTQNPHLSPTGTTALGPTPSSSTVGDRHLQAVSKSTSPAVSAGTSSAHASPGAGAGQTGSAASGSVAEVLAAALRGTVVEREVERARGHFEAETGHHEMTVLLDQAAPTAGGQPGTPHRHLHFARHLPDGRASDLWSFDLITWPGHLAISGDLGSFTFRCLHDMADFFAGQNIRPSYWAEKLVAGTPHGSFSSERYLAGIAEAMEAYRPGSFAGALDETAYAGLQQAVKRDLIDEMPQDVEEARQQLADFVYYYDGPTSRRNAFRFHDVWEIDLAGYDHRYLLACHAIQYGINRYRATYPERVIREVTSAPLRAA